MTAKISADVVNAFVDPVVDVLRTFVGIEAHPSQVAMIDHLDPPPMMVCSVELNGSLAGPVTWVFTEEMVELFASRLIAGEAMEALAGATRLDAVAEFANIFLGNATGRLSDVGYAVQMQPPKIHGPLPEDRALPGRELAVWLDSSIGRMKLIIGVRVTEEQS